MNQNILLTIAEFIASLIIEGVILSMVFNFISNKAQSQQQEFLAQELNNIEKQNKFDFEQLQTEIRAAKIDIINQIKESAENRQKDADPK
jgi:hypothetical protein